MKLITGCLLYEKTGTGFLDGTQFDFGLAYIEDIVIRPQMRKTFDEEAIQDLAANISSVGQLAEILVNHIDGNLILIAGERRVRAVRHLNAVNHTHRQMQCKIFIDLTPYDVFNLQISENMHEKVPADQEAEALFDLYCIAMSTPELQDMKVSEFCKRVKKSETKVRNAFRFVKELHPLIRGELSRNSDTITYSAAILIARLRDLEEQLIVFQRCVARGAKREEEVKAFLKPFLDKQNGQEELFKMRMDQENQIKALLILLHTSETMHYRTNIQFQDRIVSAIERGVLPKSILTPSMTELILRALEIRDRVKALIDENEKASSA